MRRIFFPDMHSRMPKALAKSLKNDVILLPDSSFSEHIKYWKKWDKEEIENYEYFKDTNNIKSCSYKEFFENQPDIIIVSCYEVSHDIYKLYNQLDKEKTKLVHYAGNNHIGYDLKDVKNLLTTDELIFHRAKLNKKNVLFYLPWVDFDNDYSFQGIVKNNIINSYILRYKVLFQEAYSIALQCSDLFKKMNYNVNFIENATNLEVPNLMHDSFATLHIKPIEGYGFSILESMAKGRPVILYKPYSEQKTYQRWSFDMETCIYFNTLEELKEKFLFYIKNCEEIQVKCSNKIRSTINLEGHNSRINLFLNDLR